MKNTILTSSKNWVRAHCTKEAIRPFIVVAIMGAVLGYAAHSYIATEEEDHPRSRRSNTFARDINDDDMPDAFFHYKDTTSVWPLLYEEDKNFDGNFDLIIHYNSLGNTEFREEDVNFDGKVDAVMRYNAYDQRESEKADYDFDGYVETHITFHNDLIVQRDIDIDGDKKRDFSDIFEHGQLVRRHFYAPNTDALVKTNHYKNTHLISAEVDTDGDGFFDTRRNYDRYEEVIGTKKSGS